LERECEYLVKLSILLTANGGDIDSLLWVSFAPRRAQDAVQEG